MKDIAKQIINFIQEQDEFLLTTHMNADGDAFASVLAIAYLIKNLKKKYQIVIHDQQVDSKYNFLWGIKSIQSYSPEITPDFGVAIVLDVPSLKRVGDPAVLIPSRNNCVKIDHHPPEEDFAAYNYVDVNASSTSQLIYDLIEMARISLTKPLSELIFAGIMYDTGRFSFSNTRQRDFEIAAELVKYGAQPHRISGELFFNNSFHSMRTLGYALANMKMLLDGKLSVIFIPIEIMESSNHVEIEELANYSVAIHGVEVGIFIREVQPHYFKISFRSKGKVNVNSIAKGFGGGGHMHAAGARYAGQYADLEQKITVEVQKFL
jgi:bifunctional oligoribonuclease and PAP phosphatase NrnA